MPDKQKSINSNNPDGLLKDLVMVSMSGSRKFCQRGPTSTTFFSSLVDEGREDPNTANHHASEIPFKLRFAGVPTMAQH